MTYNEFVKRVVELIESKGNKKRSGASLSAKEKNSIKKELISIKDDFDRDDPTALPPRLILNRLFLRGKKTAELNQNGIRFDWDFLGGVNVLVADHSMGKSSILEFIHFSLTGDHNGIQGDIIEFPLNIYLEFKIKEQTYTTFIQNRIEDHFKGALFKTNIDNLLAHEEGRPHKGFSGKFECDSEKQYSSAIQDFFFKELSYYTLKYTRIKKDLTRTEIPVGWNNYFNSIYLSTIGYTYLFARENIGNQSGKLVEMLLGLNFSYPINQLKVLLKLIEAEESRLKAAIELTSPKIDKDERKIISNEIKALEKEISEIDATLKKPHLDSKILQYLENTRAKIETEAELMAKSLQKIDEVNTKRASIDVELKSLLNEKVSLGKEVPKLKRRIHQIEEFIEIGIFLSGIEVESCPNCGKDVSEDDLLTEKQEHKCRVCHDPVDSNQDIDSTEYEKKLENQKTILKRREIDILDLSKEEARLKVKDNELYDQLVKFKMENEENKGTLKLLSLEEQNLVKRLNEPKSARTQLIERKAKIREKIAVLTYRLTKEEPRISPEETPTFTEELERIKKRKTILNTAIVLLQEVRQERSSTILNELKMHVWNQMIQLGNHSIKDIVIKQNLTIKFIKGQKETDFMKLTPGERLRVKIAFYLGLILLMVERGYGRHSRLLLIDSPAREEMEKKDVQSMKNIFQQIEEKWHGELQLVITTAERRLSQITHKSKSKIFPTETHVF